MGTVLEKANEIKRTKNKLKEAINNGGGQITDNTIFNDYANEIKDIYIDAINDGVDNLYNNFPKITEEGSKITLDTEEAPINITLEGNTSQKTSVLPEEYTQVDYIEGTGTQYLDTNIPMSDIIKVEGEFAYNSTSSIQGFFGRYTANLTTIQSILNNSNSSINFKWLSENFTIALDTNKHSFILSNQEIVIDGVVKKTYNLEKAQDNYSLVLMARRDDGSGSGTKNYASMKIYNFKIHTDNGLVRNFIPCYRNSDNEVGMYDLITDTFYTNQGTSVFTYNSVVQIPNPDYPQNIKVVTGEQNIKIVNKNLFDKDNDVTLKKQASFSGIEDNKFTTSNTNVRTLIITKVPSNSEITLSINNNNYIQSRYFISQLKTPTIEAGKNERWYTGNSTIVTTNKTNYLGIVLDIKNNGTTVNSTQEAIDEMKIQIEEGSATSYVLYQLQTYPLSLSNLNLVKIGNYKDYIFKNVTGNPYYNANLDLNEWYYSNLFTKINSYNGETITTPYISTTGGLDIGATIYYYNNSNVPIKITNTTLISQLENINNAKSYSDITIIECSSINDDNETIQALTTALKNIDLIESEWSL